MVGTTEIPKVGPLAARLGWSVVMSADSSAALRAVQMVAQKVANLVARSAVHLDFPKAVVMADSTAGQTAEQTVVRLVAPWADCSVASLVVNSAGSSAVS